MNFLSLPIAYPKQIVQFIRVLRLLSSPGCDGESITPEERYEMASLLHSLRRYSDIPLRTAIRWVLARLNAMLMDCPSTVMLL